MDNPELETILNELREKIKNLEKRVEDIEGGNTIDQTKKEIVNPKDIIVGVDYGVGESKNVMSVFIKPHEQVKLSSIQFLENNSIQAMFVLPVG